MRVLGLDPGTATTGYGAIVFDAGKTALLEYGAIYTLSSMNMPTRLCKINQDLKALIDKLHPDAVVVEQLYYHKNSKTVITVAQSRGVILMTAALAGIEVFEYTPLQIKQAVVGYGGADKKQVQYMVQKLLALPEKPKPDDAADALAASICHINSYRLGRYRK